LSRAAKTTARWKSRKAGERALRYIFLVREPQKSSITCYKCFGRDFFRPERG
jgi:hypothetical protein